MDLNIGLFDQIVLIGYFCLVLFVAFYATFKIREEKENKKSSDYFLASKNLTWFAIGASLFASNIGSEHLIGLAGAGAKGDFVSGQFEILASIILLFLGWVFVPFYLKSGVFTMPEFLERRYSTASRNYLSIVSIFAYIITKISVTIFAGAIVLEVMIGIDFWSGALAILALTGLYTVAGGLRAVIYTDVFQTFVLIIGSLAVIFYGLEAVGGIDGLTEALSTTEKKEDYLSLWRSVSDKDFPWPAILFGAPILGIWYWCTDQFIVQRVLSARDISQARKGTIFAGFLKLLPVFLFLIPGVIAYAANSAYPELLGVTASGEINYDKALPALAMNFLPDGFRGLVAAGLLAALMSSLSSVFNSCSTLFVHDFYKKWKPDSTEDTLVLVGQFSTGFLVVVGMAWIPFMKTLTEKEGLFYYIQSVQAYISPPIAAAFLFGLFYKKLNARGASWALWSGFIIGILRLVLEVLTNGYQDSPSTAYLTINPDGLIAKFIEINFLYFALIMFVFCSIVLFVASKTAPAPDEAKLENVIYKRTPKSERKTQKRDVQWSIALIIAVIIVWLIFSPLGIS